MVNESKIEAIKKGKPLSLIDIIVMAVVLIAALLLIFFVVYGKEGAYLSVSYNGQETFYSLSKDNTIDIGGYVKIKIENGYAFVVEADCKNQDCKDLGGKIKYVGQKIVCLPNRIVLKVVNSDNADPGWVAT